MAKDYFQDILPPQGSSSPKGGGSQAPSPALDPDIEDSQSDDETISAPVSGAPPQNTRSIRNINVSPRPPRRAQGSEREIPGTLQQFRTPRRIAPRIWMWIIAALSIAVLGAILLVAMRPTTISVIPRSHVIVFDSSLQFRAYPRGDAAMSSLSYTIETVDLEDSSVVPANGKELVEERASGTIVVVNNYSAESVRLVKNTRFETPDGLIFKTPSEVIVPGKIGTRSGEVSVEVFAEATGEKYNVGPITRFTLPGLKTTPAMYADVYARSGVGMSGGFVGERPIVAPSAVESAKAEIRGRLEQKARTAMESKVNDESIVLADLIRITYTSLPNTEEAGGGARIREKAHIEIPVFPAALFAQTVARGASADAEDGSVMLKDVTALTARVVESNETSASYVDSFDFTLLGTALLVWKVDAKALAEALAGREEAAFEAIVASFPGVEEARARVQPFWKNSFPTDPNDIQVHIEEPVPSGA